jgi:TP901 family phage tail tape measure protein
MEPVQNIFKMKSALDTFQEGLLAASQKASGLKNKLKNIKALNPQVTTSLDKLNNSLKKLRRAASTEADLKKLNNELTNTAGKIKNLNKVGQSFSFPKFNSILGKNPKDIFTSSIRSIITDGAKFSSEMSSVKAVTNATEAEFNKLHTAANELGKNSPFSSIKIAKEMKELGKAGHNVDQILSVLPNSMSLAGAAGISLRESSSSLSNVMTGFGKSAKDSLEITDLLARANNSSKGSLLKFSEAMKELAPNAKKMNMSLEDTATLTALMANNGRQGSSGTKDIGTALNNILNPSKEAKKIMNDLGFSFFDANKKFKGMPHLISELETKLSSLSSKKKNSIISSIFGENASDEINLLMKEGSKGFSKTNKKITNKNLTAKKISDIKNDNLTGDLTKFSNSLGVLKNKLFDLGDSGLRKLEQMGTEFINSLDPVINGIGIFFSAFSPLVDAIGILAVGLGLASSGATETSDAMNLFALALEVASFPIRILSEGLLGLTHILEPVLPLLKWVGIGLGVITTAQWAWNLALDANKISLVIIGIVGLVGGIKMLWDKFAGFRGVLKRFLGVNKIGVRFCKTHRD